MGPRAWPGDDLQVLAKFRWELPGAAESAGDHTHHHYGNWGLPVSLAGELQAGLRMPFPLSPLEDSRVPWVQPKPLSSAPGLQRHLGPPCRTECKRPVPRPIALRAQAREELSAGRHQTEVLWPPPASAVGIPKLRARSPSTFRSQTMSPFGDTGHILKKVHVPN